MRKWKQMTSAAGAPPTPAPAGRRDTAGVGLHRPPVCSMCPPQLRLLTAVVLMLPEAARQQPSSSPAGALPTSTVLGPAMAEAGTEPAWVGTAAPPEPGGTPSVPGNETTDPFPVLPICVCDLTPGTCDLNCCCDQDCDLLHPRTVFSFCLPGSVRPSSWVCVDNSLIFRSNSPFPSRVFTDSSGITQFCVLVNNSKLNYFQELQTVNATNFQALAAEFGGQSFSSALQTQPPLPFYRAGDPILAYYPNWSLISLLRQPAVGAGGLCVESNPASFLENKRTTCPRFFKNLASSCTSDPALDAASYYNFTVLKVPKGITDLQNMQFQVPITLASQTSSPLLAGNTCQNIVSEVIYDIETNGTFGIQKVSVSIGQTNLSVEPGVSFQQDFIIHFRAFHQRTAALPAAPRSGNPGYIVGKPLLVLTGDVRHSMTLLQSQGNGICSVKRHDVQFGVNAVSGCRLRLKEVNCSLLQKEIYQTLHGRLRPEQVAMFGNADPAQKGGWTRILNKNCSVSARNCTSCCFIPVSLEIQVLWAYVGLQSNPQAHVAGARFLYQCKYMQDHQKGTEVALTTLVNFVDITQKPEPPRDQARTDWKLPFDFFFPFKVEFSRGADQRNSVSPSLILCLLLLGVLSSQTK